MAAVFASGYQVDLFFPFVAHFVQHLDNPWQHYFSHQLPQAFPYPPLMLYLLSLGALLPVMAGAHLPASVGSLLFKLPTLVADLAIFALLLKIFPTRRRAVFGIYFLSPIVLYAAYIHSQLDLIPMALLLASVYGVTRNRLRLASILFGLAISIKFHVIAALPLILIYLIKNKKHPGWFVFAPLAIYAAFAAPFLGSEGYFHHVLNNPEQRQVFSVYFPFDQLRLYLAPLAVMLIYARFLGYAKVNKDLLLSTLGLLFSVFICLVPPMPGWYLWMLPFAAISFIKADPKNTRLGYMVSAALALSYLAYFVCFHHAPFDAIYVLGTPHTFKIEQAHLRNLAFTLLQGSLLATIYFLYKFGHKSNSLYRQKEGAFVIGIGGDSGAGKSTLLTDLKALLTEEALLEVEGDGDHKWERGDENWQRFTHLNPKANHLHRQSENLLALKRGDTIQRVEYDHHTGKFTAPQHVASRDFVVMCGLHPFYLPKMRKAIDLKIYLETDEQLRRHWKIKRDTVKRGYSTETVLTQIEARVSDAEKFIHPQKQYADLIISYFTEDAFLLGDPEAKPSINLKLAVDSSVHLEPLIEALEREGILLTHDYSADLKTQYLLVSTELIHTDFEAIASRLIENPEEVLPSGGSWQQDYRGLVQLIILLMISEKRKEVSDHEV